MEDNSLNWSFMMCLLKRNLNTIRILFLILLYIALLHIQQTWANTEVNGNVTVDTTWVKTNSPYIVTNTVQVLEGVKLVIEPGVTVKFNSGTGLSIGGELNAIGTADQMIIFTSSQPIPNKGDWNGIYFVDGAIDAELNDKGDYLSGSILKYCMVEYGGPGIKIEAASPLLVNNYIIKNIKGGIISYRATNPLIIANNIIEDNITNNRGGGISVSDAYETILTIESNEITNNIDENGMGGGIYFNGGTANINNNLISNNKVLQKSGYGDGGGIFFLGIGEIKNNYILYNSAGSEGSGGGINLFGLASISNNLIVSNFAGNKGGGISIEGHYDVLEIKHNEIRENLAGSGAGIFIEPYYNEKRGSVNSIHLINNNNIKGYALDSC